MRKFLLSMAAVASLSSAAVAADVPVKAPKPLPPPAAMWDGYYVGAHVGYLWGRTRVVDNGVLTEPHAATDGVIGGLLAGVNRQSGAFVYGLEADFGWTHARGSGSVAQTVIDLPNQYTVNWTSYVRARGGFTVTPTTLLYLAGGLALADFRFQEGGTLVVGGGIPVGTVFAGWTIGGGIDHVLVGKFTNTSKLIGRIEYLYADFGNKVYSPAPDDAYKVGFTSHTLRGALILQFD